MGNVVALCGRQAAGSVESTTDHVNSRMISPRLRRVQHFRLLRFADCRKYVTGRRVTYQFALESVIIKCSDRNSLRGRTPICLLGS
jgi:hypothetical protein